MNDRKESQRTSDALVAAHAPHPQKCARDLSRPAAHVAHRHIVDRRLLGSSRWAGAGQHVQLEVLRAPGATASDCLWLALSQGTRPPPAGSISTRPASAALSKRIRRILILLGLDAILSLPIIFMPSEWADGSSSMPASGRSTHDLPRRRRNCSSPSGSLWPSIMHCRHHTSVYMISLFRDSDIRCSTTPPASSPFRAGFARPAPLRSCSPSATPRPARHSSSDRRPHASPTRSPASCSPS